MYQLLCLFKLVIKLIIRIIELFKSIHEYINYILIIYIITLYILIIYIITLCINTLEQLAINIYIYILYVCVYLSKIYFFIDLNKIFSKISFVIYITIKLIYLLNEADIALIIIPIAYFILYFYISRM